MEKLNKDLINITDQQDIHFNKTQKNFFRSDLNKKVKLMNQTQENFSCSPDRDQRRLNKVINLRNTEDHFYSQFQSNQSQISPQMERITQNQDNYTCAVKSNMLTGGKIINKQMNKIKQYSQFPTSDVFTGPSTKTSFELNMTSKIDYDEIEFLKADQVKYDQNDKKLNIAGTEYSISDGLKTNLNEDIMHDYIILQKKKEMIKTTEIINSTIPKVLSFDNRRVDDPSYNEFAPQKFDFNDFAFYQNDSAKYKLNQFQNEFLYAKNNKTNKKLIFKQMTELIYDRIEHKLSSNFEKIPETLNQNKNKFCQMMLKNPKIQKLYISFNEELTKILDNEIKNNKGTIGMFLLHPHERKLQQYKMKEKEEQVQVVAKPEIKKDLKIKMKEEIQDLFKNIENRKNLNFVQQATAISNKKKYTDFQMELLINTQNINDLVNSMDSNNTELNKSIVECQTDLEKMEAEKRRLNLPQIPGRKINQKIQEWAQEEVQYDDQINQYASELWVSLKEYEEQIQSEHKGYDLELSFQKNKFEWKINDMLQKFDFVMEANDTALNNLKLQSQQELDRANMIIAELESKQLNQDIQNHQMIGAIEEIEKGMKVKNLAEARSALFDLGCILKKNFQQISDYKQTIESMDNYITSIKEKSEDLKQNILDEAEQRLFYQHLLLKFIRDIHIFKNDNVKQTKFERINEFSKKTTEQKEYVLVLKDLDLKTLLIDEANKKFGMKNHLLKLKEQMTQLDPILIKANDISSFNNNLEQKKKKDKKDVTNFKNLTKKDLWLMNTLQFTIVNLIQKGITGHNEDPEATLESGAPTRPLDDEIELRKSSKQKKEKKRQGTKKQLLKKPFRHMTTAAVPKMKLKANSSNRNIYNIEEASANNNSDDQSKISESKVIISNDESQQIKNTDQNQNEQAPSLSNSIPSVDSKGSVSDITSLNKSIKKQTHNKKQRDFSFKIKKTKRSLLKAHSVEYSKLHVPSVLSLKCKEEELSNFKNSKSESSLSSNSLQDSVKELDAHLNSSKKNIKKKELKIFPTINTEDAELTPIMEIGGTTPISNMYVKLNFRNKLGESLQGEFDILIAKFEKQSETNIKQVDSQKSPNEDQSEKQSNRQNSKRHLSIDKIDVTEEEASREDSQFQKLNQVQYDESVSSIEEPQQLSQSNKSKNNETLNQTSQRENSFEIQKVIDIDEQQSESIPTQSLQLEKSIEVPKRMEPLEQIQRSLQLPNNLKSQTMEQKKSSHSTNNSPKQQKTKTQRKQSYKQSSKTMILEIKEPELTGICRIDQELNQLIDQKYSNLKEKVSQYLQENSKAFNLNAQQITHLQSFVEHTLNAELPSSDYQSLFVGSIEEFFNAFNSIVAKQYKFENVDAYLQAGSGGNVNTNTISDEKVQESLLLISKQKKKEKTVKSGDILKPYFDINGEFLGFKVRSELALACFHGGGDDISYLKKVIKQCLFINRVIRDGMSDDFSLTQVKNGAAVVKKYESVMIQVDSEELKNNVVELEEDEEKPKTEEQQLFDTLKEYAINLVTRSNPTVGKKGYYRLVWDNFSLFDLMDFEIQNVFLQRKNNNSKSRGTKFKDIFQFIISSLSTKLMDAKMKQEDRENLIIENYIFRGDNKEMILPIYASKLIQVQAETKNMASMTDKQQSPKLMPPPIQKIQIQTKKQINLPNYMKGQDRISKHNQIFDLALESEIQYTFELFDQFVHTLNKTQEKNASFYGNNSQLIDQEQETQDDYRNSINNDMNIFRKKLSAIMENIQPESNDTVSQDKSIYNLQLNKKQTQMFNNLNNPFQQRSPPPQPSNKQFDLYINNISATNTTIKNNRLQQRDLNENFSTISGFGMWPNSNGNTTKNSSNQKFSNRKLNDILYDLSPQSQLVNQPSTFNQQKQYKQNKSQKQEVFNRDFMNKTVQNFENKNQIQSKPSFLTKDALINHNNLIQNRKTNINSQSVTIPIHFNVQSSQNITLPTENRTKMRNINNFRSIELDKINDIIQNKDFGNINLQIATKKKKITLVSPNILFPIKSEKKGHLSNKNSSNDFVTISQYVQNKDSDLNEKKNPYHLEKEFRRNQVKVRTTIQNSQQESPLSINYPSYITGQSLQTLKLKSKQNTGRNSQLKEDREQLQLLDQVKKNIQIQTQLNNLPSYIIEGDTSYKLPDLRSSLIEHATLQSDYNIEQ